MAGGSISARPARSPKGLGLVSIKERVRLAGGTVSLVTEVNKGTRVRVEIPANRQAMEPGPRVGTVRDVGVNGAVPSQ